MSPPGKMVGRAAGSAAPAKRQLSLFESMKVSPACAGPSSSSSSAAAASSSSKRVRTTSDAPFDRHAFYASLSDAPPRSTSLATSTAAVDQLSEKELLRLECETMEASWLQAMQEEIRKPSFIALKKFLWTEGLRDVHHQQKKVYPLAKNIYSWSRYTPIDAVKVIVIGQDPYHDDNQAHGLSFSVPRGVKIPPSLRNIHLNLRASYPTFPATAPHGSLIASARSGVLWLNTSLSVRAHEAGSHKGKWEAFTSKVLEEVTQGGKGVVVMAWGAWAQKCAAKVDTKKHLVLSSVHPSPLSAHRGFLTNGHFVAANAWLEKKYGSEAKIDWTKLNYEDDPPIVNYLTESINIPVASTSDSIDIIASTSEASEALAAATTLTSQ